MKKPVQGDAWARWEVGDKTLAALGLDEELKTSVHFTSG